MTRKEFNLSRARRNAGLTQEQLADMSGYSARQVRRHETEALPQRAEIHYKNIFEKISK